VDARRVLDDPVVNERARSEPEVARRWSVPLVSISGVTIRVHVTFLALVLLVALTAGESGESALAAAGWLVVLFACVVVHELAHSFVARSKGVAVHEIDLLPIGGVSRMERLPDSWRDESAIAAAGPIASVTLAMLAFALAAAAGLPLLPPSVWEGPLLVRVAWANVLLAGFNLLPAFPLDGGRVFRALLERDRSRVEATRQAAGVSRVLAGGMVGLGVLFNFWLVVIGLFVLVAGSAEVSAVLVHAALGPMPAGALAVPSPVALPGDMLAAEGARLAALHPQAGYPVTEPDGTVLGLVNLGALRGSTPTTPVRLLASGTVVDARESLEHVAEQISNGPVAVTSHGSVVGVITLDILNEYLRQRLHEIET
jgi:Zn-dependent protease